MCRNAERQFAEASFGVAVSWARRAVTVPRCATAISRARFSHGSIGWSADSNASTTSPPITVAPAFRSASAWSSSRRGRARPARLTGPCELVHVINQTGSGHDCSGHRDRGIPIVERHRPGDLPTRTVLQPHPRLGDDAESTPSEPRNSLSGDGPAPEPGSRWDSLVIRSGRRCGCWARTPARARWPS